MLESYPSVYVITAGLTVGSIFILLGFFLWKTLITSNLFQKGLSLYQQKDYIGAEAAFRNVMRLNSTNDMVHLLLGDALMRQDKLEEATQQFEEVVRRAPKKVDAYLRLGQALMQQDKLTEAIAPLQKAIDLFKRDRQEQKAAEIKQILRQISTQSTP